MIVSCNSEGIRLLIFFSTEWKLPGSARLILWRSLMALSQHLVHLEKFVGVHERDTYPRQTK